MEKLLTKCLVKEQKLLNKSSESFQKSRLENLKIMQQILDNLQYFLKLSITKVLIFSIKLSKSFFCCVSRAFKMIEKSFLFFHIKKLSKKLLFSTALAFCRSSSFGKFKEAFKSFCLYKFEKSFQKLSESFIQSLYNLKIILNLNAVSFTTISKTKVSEASKLAVHLKTAESYSNPFHSVAKSRSQQSNSIKAKQK